MVYMYDIFLYLSLLTLTNWISCVTTLLLQSVTVQPPNPPPVILEP